MNNEIREVEIPFPGFYESALSEMVDREIENLFSLDGEEGQVPPEFYNMIPYKLIYVKVAQLYVEAMEAWIQNEVAASVSMKYKAMESPREYNFSTDRVFVEMSFKDITTLLRCTGWENVAEVARSRFTSCSGFISFYDPDIREWGKLSEWDHNQLGTILYSLCADEGMDDAESLMESARCNGDLATEVYDCLCDDAIALIDQHREGLELAQREHEKYEHCLRFGICTAQ